MSAPHADLSAPVLHAHDARGVHTLTLNRPASFNTLSEEVLAALQTALDAIALEPGARIKLFLTVLPLSPMDATVSETSYQAVLSPEGVASYRLRAVFNGSQEQARIGLRGTAKVHGERVLLGYYLLRRPLATLREWSGW